MSDYTHPNYLIDPKSLAAKLGNKNLRVLDGTIFLVRDKQGYKADSGQEKYLEDHVPGSIFMDQLRVFSDTSTGLGFSLPNVEQLQEAFRSVGVNNDSQVVFYSSGNMMWATRAWWLGHYAGLKDIAVLNGGFERWKSEGLPTESGAQSAPKGDVTLQINPERFVDKSAVLAAMQNDRVCTVNALSPDVYQGTGEHHYGRRGHIPGSLNLHYDDLLEDGAFRPAAELKAALNNNGMLNAERVITYCGGGISATIDAFACLLVGKEEVAVYDGSMSEWVRDKDLPLKEGAEP